MVPRALQRRKACRKSAVFRPRHSRVDGRDAHPFGPVRVSRIISAKRCIVPHESVDECARDDAAKLAGGCPRSSEPHNHDMFPVRRDQAGQVPPNAAQDTGRGSRVALHSTGRPRAVQANGQPAAERAVATARS